jgi:hypothetical protein
MAPISLTWKDVRALRLARHHLLERAPRERLVDVVGAVCGIHAQVMPAAEVSLGVRVESVTRTDVRAALWDQRSLVKTYAIRGTVHLLPAGELPLWMAAQRARPPAKELKRLSRFGLDRNQLDSIVAAIADALDGRSLTLRQLGEEVAGRCGSWALAETAPAFGGNFPIWRIAIGWAASEGQLCFGPNQGNQVTFVRPDQWLGWWREVEPGAALAEVFRRYLRAYGPATARDFAQWFSVDARFAAELSAELGGDVVQVDVEGYRCLAVASDLAAALPDAGGSVRLLPHFDCYLRGFHPREQLVGGWAERSARGTGEVPVLVVEGMVAGVWERKPRGRRLEVTVESFQKLSAAERLSLEAEARRIGEILEAETTLAVGTVAIRPHL